MPFIGGTSTPSSSEVELDNDPLLCAQQIVNDASYAGSSLPGASEKPLSEQLEPIAVVGMGNNISSSHTPTMQFCLMCE